MSRRPRCWAPTWVALGTVPLGSPRDVTDTPSLVDEPERALLRRHPKIRILVVEGAPHNLVMYAKLQILEIVYRLLAETGLAPRPDPG